MPPADGTEAELADALAHQAAVEAYRAGIDEPALRDLRGVVVARCVLETDPEELDEWFYWS